MTGDGWLFNQTIRYRAAILGVGARVSILGAGVREAGPDAMPTATYGDSVPARIRMIELGAAPAANQRRSGDDGLGGVNSES